MMEWHLANYILFKQPTRVICIDEVMDVPSGGVNNLAVRINKHQNKQALDPLCLHVKTTFVSGFQDFCSLPEAEH